MAIESRPAHRDIERVTKALGSNQIVVYIGARGVGKSLLAHALRRHLADNQLEVITVNVGEARTIEDLHQPVGERFGAEGSLPRPDTLDNEVPVRVIIDNCHSLHSTDWSEQFQYEWRALLTAQEARGRISALFLGRPLFRNILGGPASSLLNAAYPVLPCPLSPDEVQEQWDIPPHVAHAVLQKTGGHPELTARLLQEGSIELERLADRIESFLSRNARYVMAVVGDHGEPAKHLLNDLVAAPEGLDEGAILRSRFASDQTYGLECIEDLIASGLVQKRDVRVAIAAEMLRSPAGRALIRTAEDTPPPTASPEHAAAAALLYQVENRLRERLIDIFTAHDPSWWPVRVKDRKAAGLADQRREEELRSRFAPDEQFHPLYYSDLGVLQDLVLGEANWPLVSVALHEGGTLLAKRDIQESFEDLRGVRNKVAHNRPVTADDLMRLRSAARRLGFAVPES